MKFGHAFTEALAAESYPPHWVDKAIPYRQLKKVLGKLREELIRSGYGPDTLHHLLENHDAEYRLEADESHLLRPRLVVRPPLLPLEAATSAPADPATVTETAETAPLGLSQGDDENPPAPSTPVHNQAQEDQWVKIPLNSDARFFKILQTDVSELDTLQGQERQSMNEEISKLGNEIAQVARPRALFLNLSKSDLYRWREIFEIYLSAEVFFSTTEVSGGIRSSEKAQKQLVWFQTEVNKRQLPHKFKLETSATAFSLFMTLNATLLQNLQFQELNQTAVTKIIKKFDKQTSLGVRRTFPKVISSASFITECVSKNICSQLSLEVLNRVPQVVDYTCMVCISICWLPIRLDCTHLFCIRCMIKMQNSRKRRCPLCRAETVQKATEEHIDMELTRYLERWFPKETKEKQTENEAERRKELFGDHYADQVPPCVVM